MGENPGLPLIRLALCGASACSSKSHWGWFSSRNTAMFRQRRRGRDAAQRATYLEDLSIAFKRHERELEQRNWVQFPSLIRAGPVRMYVTWYACHGDSSQPLPNRLLPADTYNVSPGWRSSWELLNEQGAFWNCLRSQPQSYAWDQAELMLSANMHI